jgi:DNA-binding XRE family transcriptional regulator
MIMTNLDKNICALIKAARREQGISQSELAVEVGCKQSAISAFENGDPTKLSEETVKKLAGRLGVSLEEKKTQMSALADGYGKAVVRGFCPDPNCVSNIPYAVGNRLYYHTTLRGVTAQNGKRCAHCGEILEMRCPACGAPLNEGACCIACGEAYVAPQTPDTENLVEWASRRRAEIKDIRALV